MRQRTGKKVVTLTEERLEDPDISICIRFGYRREGPYVGYPSTSNSFFKAEIPPGTAVDLPRSFKTYEPWVQVWIGDDGPWVELGQLPGAHAPLTVERCGATLRFLTLKPSPEAAAAAAA